MSDKNFQFDYPGEKVFSVWDDKTISPNTLPLFGANPPTHKIVASDGSTTYGTAGLFNGSTSDGTVPDYAALDMASMSLAMWVNPNAIAEMEIIDRDGTGGFEFYINASGELAFSPDGSAVVVATGVLAGATQLVVATIEDIGSSVRVKLYIDGSEKINQLIPGSQLASSALGLIVGEHHAGGRNFNGIIDDIQMYNVVLTTSQVSEIYNAGVGLTDANAVPSGITEATDLVVRFQNSATDASTIGIAASSVMSLNDVSLVDGLLGVTTGSRGVSLLSFLPGVTNEMRFTAQLPHSYKAGSDIKPHVHWAAPVDTAGDVVWGLEYLWRVKDQAIGNTTLVDATITPSSYGAQLIDGLGTLDGDGMGISSILVCRLYRKGDAAADTYQNEVYLSEFDFHFQADAPGSRNEWSR